MIEIKDWITWGTSILSPIITLIIGNLIWNKDQDNYRSGLERELFRKNNKFQLYYSEQFNIVKELSIKLTQVVQYVEDFSEFMEDEKRKFEINVGPIKPNTHWMNYSAEFMNQRDEMMKNISYYSSEVEVYAKENKVFVPKNIFDRIEGMRYLAESVILETVPASREKEQLKTFQNKVTEVQDEIRNLIAEKVLEEEFN